MSEINEQVTENEPGTGESGTETGTASTSILNQVVEAVMDMIDALSLFATISRGALGTGDCLCCEVGPSGPEYIWFDKNQFIPLDLTINGKHSDLQTLSDAMNNIHESLTMAMSYTSGSKWQIVDIATLTEPQIIGREQDNSWIMASALLVKVATLTPEPTPEPDPVPDPEPDTEPAEETGE